MRLEGLSKKNGPCERSAKPGARLRDAIITTAPRKSALRLFLPCTLLPFTLSPNPTQPNPDHLDAQVALSAQAKAPPQGNPQPRASKHWQAARDLNLGCSPPPRSPPRRPQGQLPRQHPVPDPLAPRIRRSDRRQTAPRRAGLPAPSRFRVRPRQEERQC